MGNESGGDDDGLKQRFIIIWTVIFYFFFSSCFRTPSPTPPPSPPPLPPSNDTPAHTLNDTPNDEQPTQLKDKGAMRTRSKGTSNSNGPGGLETRHVSSPRYVFSSFLFYSINGHLTTGRLLVRQRQHPAPVDTSKTQTKKKGPNNGTVVGALVGSFFLLLC